MENVSSSGVFISWCPWPSKEARVPSGASWTVAVAPGPRPLSCMSHASETVPSGERVVLEKPQGLFMQRTTRCAVVAGAAEGGVLLATGATDAVGGEATGGEGSPPQAMRERGERKGARERR